MITVEEITKDEDFFNLKDDWNTLLSKSQANNLFLTWDWLYTWWKYFGENKELKILLLKDDKLRSIVPFYASKNKMKFLGSFGAGSDYLDFIIQKGSENKVISKIYDYFKNNTGWETITLTGIPSELKNSELIQRYYKDSCYVIAKDYSICPYSPLPDNYDNFLKSLSSNMRSNIKKKRNKFEQLNGKFIVVNEKKELAKAINEFINLNLNRMDMKDIYSPFNNENFLKFHKDIMASFFDKGWLRLCFLKINNKHIAGIYIIKYDKKYYYYQSGFDPEWKKLSPGLILFSYCMENAISEGITEFDFLQGTEDYKFRWTDNTKKNLQIKIYRKKIFYMNEKLKITAKNFLKQTFNIEI